MPQVRARLRHRQGEPGGLMVLVSQDGASAESLRAVHNRTVRPQELDTGGVDTLARQHVDHRTPHVATLGVRGQGRQESKDSEQETEDAGRDKRPI